MKFLSLYQRRFFYLLYKKLNKLIPKISDTERQVLEIGSPWWEGQFYTGKPDWQAFENIKLPTLTEAEQAFLDNETEQLCEMLDEWQITTVDKDLPPQVWKFIKQKGFWALVIEKEYGGKAFSAELHSRVIMKLASKSLTAAVTVMVPNSLGPAELLQRYGTTSQKKHYLPKLATGEEIPCFGLTGPYAGSDAASMADTGEVCQRVIKGQKTLSIKLNFRKRYITLAPIATLIGLAFKLYDPKHLLGDKNKTDYGITLGLLPRNTAGLEIGARHNPLDQAFMNGTISGTNVFMPIDQLIGGQEMAGQGWRMLMECLAVGRAISLPAIATAVGAFSGLMTGAYATIREQFNVSIGDFEGVQEALARIAGYSYIMEATRCFTLAAMLQGKHPAVASAITKYHLTELARETINHAMDIHGGKAIMLGPKNYLRQAYQSVPICITVEGANILTRNLIIFGQGAVQCHPHIKTILESVPQQTKPAFKQFGKAIRGIVAQVCRNIWYTKWWCITDGIFTKVPNSKFRRYYQHINRMSAAFALVADMALITLGSRLKRKERISARLGDINSHLYMASAVLKCYQMAEEPDDESVIVEWSLQYCLHQASLALDNTIRNFPHTWLRVMLRMLIMPFGLSHKTPDDDMDHQVSQCIMRPGRYRDRLKNRCFVSKKPEDVVRIVEDAFQLQHRLRPVMDKIRKAIKDEKINKDLTKCDRIKQAKQQKIITDTEAAQLLKLEKMRLDIIETDAFEQ